MGSSVAPYQEFENKEGACFWFFEHTAMQGCGDAYTGPAADLLLTKLLLLLLLPAAAAAHDNRAWAAGWRPTRSSRTKKSAAGPVVPMSAYSISGKFKWVLLASLSIS
jgi:hypothetical protein